MEFKEHGMGQGKLVAPPGGKQKKHTPSSSDVLTHTTYCIPFLTMMLALKQTHIDYFSLDVEVCGKI